MSGLVVRSGAELKDASSLVILLHGRGGSARDILNLAKILTEDTSIAFLAPQAEDSTWYPLSFLAPRQDNQPKLGRAIASIQAVVDLAATFAIHPRSIVIAGFSQGACLACEYVATHPEPWAGLIAFTGGLIGPLGSDLTHSGTLHGMPAFLGSGDPDPHVPWSRVEETAAVLTAMGAKVSLRQYPGRPHSISADEIEAARELIAHRL